MCAVAVEKLGLGVSQRVLRLMSFGLHQGLPKDADIIIDASKKPLFRVLKPFQADSLSTDDIFHMINRELLEIKPQESDLLVAVGCRFGTQASVCTVRWLEECSYKEGWLIDTFHRDLTATNYIKKTG